MDVEIDDRDAFNPVLRARIVRGDRDVVEQTKSHREIALGVVPRGAHLAKGVGGRTADDMVDGVETGSDGTACRLPAAGRHDRVAIDVVLAFCDRFGEPLEPLHVVLPMRQGDEVQIVVPQGR